MPSVFRGRPAGPFTNSDVTQRRERCIDHALQSTNDILTVLHELTDGAIVCDPLKAVLGAAIELVKWVQEARANEKDGKALAQQTYDYMQVILSHVPNSDDLPQTLTKDINKVQSDLEEICKGLQALPQKRNLLKDILARVQIADAIKVFRAKLEQSKQDFLLVGAVEVRKELGKLHQGVEAIHLQITNTQNIMIPFSSFQFSATLPPPPPHLFGREHLLDQAVLCLTGSTSTGHVAILGTGGIGKTTLAVAILHHPKIQEIHGNSRYSVPCDSLSTSEALVFALLRILNVSFDAKDPLTGLLSWLRASKPLLILLDNFESPWLCPGQQTGLTAVLHHLANTGVKLMVTMRGDSPPALGTVQWSSLNPDVLSPADAHALFVSINPQTTEAEYNDLKLLLREVDYLPLAIKLLAVLRGSNQSNTCSRLLKQWKDKRTAFLVIEAESGDHLTSLNISISLSLESKVIKSVPEARLLLHLLSHLPDGVQGGIDQLELMQLGFEDIDKALAGLCKVALVTLDGQGSIKVLAPIRHYVLGIKHADTKLTALYSWYSRLVEEYAHLNPGDLGFLEARKVLSPEIGNITSLMRMALESNTWSIELTQTTISLAEFQYWETPSTEIIDLGFTYCEMSQTPIQSLQLYTKARLLKMTQNYSDAAKLYTVARHHYAGEQNMKKTAHCLKSLGDICSMQNQYSEANTKLEQALSQFKLVGGRMEAAQCLQSLGHICMMQNQYSEAKTKLEQALSEFEAIGERMGAAHCLKSLGDICSMQNQYSEATIKLEEALSEFKAIGDRRGASQCLRSLGDILRMQNQYSEATTKLEDALSEFEAIGDRRGAAQCLRSLGDICMMQAQYSEASTKLKEALTEFKAIGGRMGAAQCLQSLGKICMMQSQYSEATTKLKGALSEFEAIGDRRGAAQCLQSLGKICMMQVQYSEASTKLKQALSAFKAIGGRRGAAQCLQSLGNISMAQHQYSEATTELKQALSEWEAIGDRMGAAQCLQSMSEICIVQSQYSKATTKLEQALSECEAIGERMGAAQCLQSLGNIFMMQDQYSEATTKLEQALSGFEAIGGRIGAAQCLKSLGNICMMQDQYSEATTKLEKALVVFEAIGGRIGAAQCLKSLGDIFMMQNQYSEATAKLEQALSEFEAIGDRTGAAQCLKSLGNICMMQDQYSEATTKLQQALSEFKAIEDRMGAAQCLQSLGNICMAQDQYTEAITKLEKALSQFKATGSRMGAAQCLQSLGNICMMQNQYGEANTKLEQALSEFHVIGSLSEISHTLQKLFQLSSFLAHHDKDPELLQQSLLHAQASGILSELAWCNMSIALTHAELHQLPKALKAINAAKVCFSQIESCVERVSICDNYILEWNEVIRQTDETI